MKKLLSLILISAATSSLFLISCAEEPEINKRSAVTTTPVETKNGSSTISRADIDFALSAAAQAKKDAKDQENSMVVIGDGRVQNLSLKFVCTKELACELPKKIFDKADLDSVPDAEREPASGIITDLFGTKLEDIKDLKKFRIVSRKEKIIVIIKFRNKPMDINVSIEQPDPADVSPGDPAVLGDVFVEGDPVCLNGSCSKIKIPFDDFMDLNAIPVEGWEVEKWTIGDALNAMLEVPNLKRITAVQTKKGLIIKVKFRKKRVITTVAQRDSCPVFPVVPLSLNQPVQVCSVADLKAIAQNTSGNFQLVCDVDLAGSNWQPLPRFSGRFDGNGKSIKNLNIAQSVAEGGSSSDLVSGLFSSLSGSVANLNIVAANAVTSDADAAGILAGKLLNGARVKNIMVSGNIKSMSQRFVGGIAGSLTDDVVIENICVDASVGVDGPLNIKYTAAGGVVGYSDLNADNTSRIDSATFLGEVISYPRQLSVDHATLQSGDLGWGPALSNNTWGAAGGIVGVADYYALTINRAKFNGRVIGALIGGVVGIGLAQISNSTSEGEILVAGATGRVPMAGGIAGMLRGHVNFPRPAPTDGSKIVRSSSTAIVTGPITLPNSGPMAGVFAGGLVGFMDNIKKPVQVIDSYTTGNVKFDADKFLGPSVMQSVIHVGGLVADISGCNITGPSVINSYSSNKVEFLNRRSSNVYHLVGGMMASAKSTCARNSYWNSKVAGVSNSSSGSAVTTNELAKKETFVGWDFVNTWIMPSGNGYPQLR